MLFIPCLIESAVSSFRTVAHQGSNTLINSHKTTIFSGNSSSSQSLFDDSRSTLPSYGYDIVTSEIQPKPLDKNFDFDMPKQGSFLRPVQVPNLEPRLAVQSGMFRPTTPRLMSQRSASAILGVSADASEKEIKEAYRKKAIALHPDLVGGNQEAMKELNQAKDILMKKNKKTDDGADSAEDKGPKKGFSAKTKAAVAGIVGTRAAIILKELMDDFKDRAEQTKRKEEKDLRPENRPENMTTSKLNDEKNALGSERQLVYEAFHIE